MQSCTLCSFLDRAISIQASSSAHSDSFPCAACCSNLTSARVESTGTFGGEDPILFSEAAFTIWCSKLKYAHVNSIVNSIVKCGIYVEFPSQSCEASWETSSKLTAESLWLYLWTSEGGKLCRNGVIESCPATSCIMLAGCRTWLYYSLFYLKEIFFPHLFGFFFERCEVGVMVVGVMESLLTQNSTVCSIL